jgi:hypothetical protein
MKPKIHTGHIIYRRLEKAGGLHESEQAFSSLDELYALVLDTKDPYLVDRIMITGENSSGAHQVVTFVFQSITISNPGTGKA